MSTQKVNPTKVIGVRLDHFKRLKIVNLDINGKNVVVTGKNGAGKSSFIDAIWTGLTGKDVPPVPVNVDGEKARIEITVSNGDEKFTVTRTYSKDGKQQSLTVKNADGASYPSPQTFLNNRMGEISFDPFDFCDMQPMKQRQMMLDFCKVDTTEIDARKAGVLSDLQELTNRYRIAEVNVDKKAATFAQVLGESGLTEDQLLAVPVDVDSIRGELANIGEAQKEKDQLARDLSQKQNARVTLALAVGNAEQKIEEYTRLLEEWKGKLAERKKELKVALKAEKEANAALEEKVVPSSSELIEELGKAETMNLLISLRADCTQAKEALETIRKEGTATKEKKEKIEQEKKDMLAAAQMPIAGLTIEEDGLKYNGLPLNKEQMSTAELIAVGVQIQMALNPNLRIIRIKDGSLLDEDTLKSIYELAAANDYQVFVEIVSNASEVGFRFE